MKVDHRPEERREVRKETDLRVLLKIVLWFGVPVVGLLVLKRVFKM